MNEPVYHALSLCLQTVDELPLATSKVLPDESRPLWKVEHRHLLPKSNLERLCGFLCVANHVHIQPWHLLSLHTVSATHEPVWNTHCEDMVMCVCPRGFQLTIVLSCLERWNIHVKYHSASKTKGYHILTNNIDELSSAYNLHKSQNLKINKTMPYVQLKCNKNT